MHLIDHPPLDQGGTVAALSRPARSAKERFIEKTCKPQGRKAIQPSKAMKYHNWFTPFLFKQIDDARRRSGGPRWSTTAIVNELKRKDITTFAGLNRTTLDGWIDRSGEKPRWSDTALNAYERAIMLPILMLVEKVFLYVILFKQHVLRY